jgi:phosphatidylinositol alpha-1,6-mannosyltransferase
MRLLTLVTDAYGERGGIAKFNRDMINALCTHPAAREVVVLPRRISDPSHIGHIPANVRFVTKGARNKLSYLISLLRVLADRERFDGILCGHINLLPLAALAARLERAPLLLVVHGIDAWKPTRSGLTNSLARRTSRFVSVSAFTMSRFTEWAQLDRDRGTLIPNCIELSAYGEGPRREDLIERYSLQGKKVILTLGRLSAAERYKGIDEVLAILGELARYFPEIVYMIAGDGDDRPRLEAKAVELSIANRVVFTGYVPEGEKVDHYRLADAFVMPGRGEGFGIVYLEALACGIPVVGSKLDGSQEALLGGKLGEVVDPNDPSEIVAGIKRALERNRGVPQELEYFSVSRFNNRWQALLDMWPVAH